MAAFPHGDPDAVVRDVLAQPVFRHAAATSTAAPQTSPWALAWGWFARHVLDPIFAGIGRALGAQSTLGTELAIALVVAAALALGFVAYRLARALGARSPLPNGADGGAPLGTARDAAGWLALARAAADRGQFGAAIAALFAAALATLDARAIVAYDAARTPGEYRRLVRGACEPAAEPFDRLASAFVRARFAPGVSDAAAFGDAQVAYERFAATTPPA